MKNGFHAVIALDLGEQKEVLLVRYEGAHPIQERLPQRNVERAGDMCRREFRRRSTIHHHHFLGEGLLQLGIAEVLRGHRLRMAIRVAIESLHHREVAWRYGLVLQHSGDEVLLALLGECPVEQLLVSERGLRHRTQGFSAG